MKILVITQYYYPESFRVTDICEELVRKGHIVDVLTAQPNYPSGTIFPGYQNKNSFEIVNGVNIYRTKIRPRKKGSLNLFLNYYSFWKNSKKRIKKFKEIYDVIYVWEISPIFYLSAGYLYKKKHKVPMICYCMDLWPESLLVRGIKKNSFIYNFFYKISRKLFSYCDGIIVSSPSFKKYLNDYLNYKGKLYFIPQHYTVSLVERREDFSNEKIDFIYAGNIGHAQKIENLIYAFKNCEEVNFHIFGNGSRYDFCREIIEKNNIKNVFMHGQVEKKELANAYENSKFCVLPLDNQTFIGNTIPAKLQEYFYYGKPILGAISGDAANLINEVDCGCLCNLNKIESIEKGIQNMIRNESKYNESTVRQKDYFLNNFTIESHVEKLLKILEESKNEYIQK